MMERGESQVLRHCGRDYVTSEEMVRIFLRYAERAFASGRPELVAMRHSKGIDFLMITDTTTFSIRHRSSTRDVEPAS